MQGQTDRQTDSFILSLVKQGQNVTFAQFSSFFKMNFFDEGKPIFNRFST